jgi:chaperonin GroEL
MNAKLATTDECISAGGVGASEIRDWSIISRSAVSRSAVENPQINAVQFDCGYLSPHFVTDPERMEVVFENAYILMHEKKLNSKKDLLPLLEQITRSGKSLLIVAEDVESDALATLVVRKLRGLLRVAAVRTPGIGDQRKSMLQDISVLTGGKAITEDLGIHVKDVQISDLGQARKITLNKNKMVVEGGPSALLNLATPWQNKRACTSERSKNPDASEVATC